MPETRQRTVDMPPAAPAPSSWSTETQRQNALKQALHWTLGLPAIAAAHGEALSGRGLELLRRALGEAGEPRDYLAAEFLQQDFVRAGDRQGLAVGRDGDRGDDGRRVVDHGALRRGGYGVRGGIVLRAFADPED